MAAILRRCVGLSHFSNVSHRGRITTCKSKVLALCVKRESWNLKFLISSHVTQRKSYASYSREYDKLWAAVTGGRGTGRGKRKKIIKGVDPEVLTFDKAGIQWAGFNAPLSVTSKVSRKAMAEGTEPFQKNVTNIFGKRWAERGWCGTTWPGRKIGHPITPDGEELTNFDSVVLELRRVSNMTAGGRKKSQRALVAVGNRNGVAGFGVGRGQTPLSAMTQARNKAVNYLYFVERCDKHTIYHDLQTRHKKTIINFFRKPPGYGIRCHRLIKEIALLLGIKDLRCKVKGATTPLSLIRATLQGFISQETHQELAERTGLNVVELRPECGMRPVIVASPSEEARKKAEKKTTENSDYNLKEIFDPYRGLHRPKRRQDLF